MKKIIIIFIVVVLGIVGAIVLFGHDDGTNTNKMTHEEITGAAEDVDSRSITIDGVTVDKNGNMLYVAPNKKPQTKGDQPAIWVE